MYADDLAPMCCEDGIAACLELREMDLDFRECGVRYTCSEDCEAGFNLLN